VWGRAPHRSRPSIARQFLWSPRALADVEAIAANIATDSSAYASSIVRRIVSLTKSRAGFPMAGRKVPEFDDESIRELFAYSYRIIYIVEPDKALISAVIHGRRML